MTDPRAARSPRTREPFSERAYRELKRRILDGELRVGDQYLELEVASMLGMSRTPCREALIRLDNEGLVEVRARHGMRVKPLSVRDTREIYDVLTALESSAAGLAATRELADDDIRRLNDAVSAMDERLASDDLDGWAEADERFHRLLLELSGNRRIVELVGNYIDQAHRVRMLTLRLRPKPVASNDDHRAVVDAIIDHDAEAARQLHWDHRERSGKLLVDLLQTHRLSQV